MEIKVLTSYSCTTKQTQHQRYIVELEQELKYHEQIVNRATFSQRVQAIVKNQNISQQISRQHHDNLVIQRLKFISKTALPTISKKIKGIANILLFRITILICIAS